MISNIMPQILQWGFMLIILALSTCYSRDNVGPWHGQPRLTCSGANDQSLTVYPKAAPDICTHAGRNTAVCLIFLGNC